jgi:hypothetical protein
MHLQRLNGKECSVLPGSCGLGDLDSPQDGDGIYPDGGNRGAFQGRAEAFSDGVGLLDLIAV